jgi:hypothetical protein
VSGRRGRPGILNFVTGIKDLRGFENLEGLLSESLLSKILNFVTGIKDLRGFQNLEGLLSKY